MLYGIRPEEQKRLAAAGETDARLRPLRRRVVRLPRYAASPSVLPTSGCFARALTSKG